MDCVVVPLPPPWILHVHNNTHPCNSSLSFMFPRTVPSPSASTSQLQRHSPLARPSAADARSWRGCRKRMITSLLASYKQKEINFRVETKNAAATDDDKEEEEEDDDDDDDENEEDDLMDTVEIESLDLLEWSSICEQVFQFASTPMGKQVCIQARIPFGRNCQESEKLLQQTASAFCLSSDLDFSEIVDITDILSSARSNFVCSIKELCIVEKTLSAVRRLYKQLECSVPRKTESSYEMNVVDRKEVHLHFSPLMSIMENSNFCASLVRELKESLDNATLSILDTASPSLLGIRMSRRGNTKALEDLLLEIGEKVVASGGMDSIMITTRRARQCIAVRASHKHLLPGGLVLDFSNSGATVFMEPKAALELNNNEVKLCAQEKAEEFAILERLTKKLADESEDIWNLLQKVTSLDLACAKAGHARWLQAVRPVFYSDFLSGKGEKCGVKSNNSTSDFSVDIEGLCHPLLLGPALMDNKNEGGTSLPTPVDFKVKSGVRVIVISGPNTGGKTASMKTLGVATLMAKAGLFLPAKGNAILPWFDKVLADIGDSQSLEQSLSTFSGHIKRVCKIIESGSDQSLVLFDEIGSGTDPSEGAALATAILQHMAECAHLTVATTHFSKLNRIKDERFDIASVEFDSKTLRPKYKVLWGIAGQSNALDIASSLGVDENILARAQHWMKQLDPENQEKNVTQLMRPLMEQRRILQSQAEVAASTLADAKSLFDELAAEADGLEMRLTGLRLQREKRVKEDIDYVKSQLDEVVSKFEKCSRNLDKTENMSMGEALIAIASIVESYTEKYRNSEKNFARPVVERPCVGDLVLINRIGRNLATVIEAPSQDDESFLVQLGSLKLRAKLSEVSKVMKQEKSSTHQQRSKQMPAQIPLEFPELPVGPAIQTSRNTVDLRGMYVEDALMHLDFSIRKSRRSVLFIVHGEGTGALRAGVLKKLKEHPLVSKFEQESPMNYGCTIAYIK